MNSTSNLTILLCESDRRILQRLESWLQTLGARVVSSDDGIHTLQVFKESTPDILLISQDLNSMGGIELIEEVKKTVPNQAVVMMLNENDTIFKRAIELQVDKYLNKPVEATSLFSAIDSLSQEKLWHKEFKLQKKALQDYKEAIDLSFSVSRHDRDGKIIYVNDLFCISTNLNYFKAMEGVLNPLNNPNEDMDKLWEALHKDKIYKDRQVFKLNAIDEKIIDVTAVALVDENYEAYEYLVFTDDVTQIVSTARKIKNQELDKRLAKINHAKELDRVRDSFLTIFTHELKTPLNSIINFSQYVQKHLAKENFEKKDRLLTQVIEIHKSGMFMLQMITNLMEAMRLKDSKFKLNIHQVELNSTLNSLLFSSDNQFSSKSIVNETESEVIISSDEERIKQIMQHLLSNALKYSSSVVLVRISSDEYDFMITIEDDGEGFRDKVGVFDLFEQSDANSLTREGVGVGTGLFIVKQLCDRIGYEIKLLDSQKLGGACVRIKGKRNLTK
ncbi:MAG: hybrid sensor histidine kinase/response regulator [Campylobacterota bacterium]|nr:hybrid sensor histidine kinase/response regulator [Campylobacterota bacterium]